MSKAMQIKSRSYYDWNQQFLNSNSQEIIQGFNVYEENKMNSLGISKDHFKDFLKEWKEKNL
ncbi:MAG: hypothetical protein ACFFBP_00050 [Promethearchaeota archaeon]